MRKRSSSNESRKANESNTSTPFVCVKTRLCSISRSQFHLSGTPAERLSEHRKLLGTSPSVNELSESCVRAKNVIEHWRMHLTLKFSSAPATFRGATRNCVSFRGGSWS